MQKRLTSSFVRREDFAASGETIANVMSHADMGDTCGQCHAPFQGVEAALWEDCHKGIATERENDGLHGRLPNVAQCENCHLEHEGADYDLKTAACHTDTATSKTPASIMPQSGGRIVRPATAPLPQTISFAC
jgi:hypothetical protein